MQDAATRMRTREKHEALKRLKKQVDKPASHHYSKQQQMAPPQEAPHSGDDPLVYYSFNTRPA